jgi:NitT/TauT family transport system permease protein
MSADTEQASALTGLDNLEAGPAGTGRSPGEVTGKIWRSLWPKVLAIVIALAIWELVYVLKVKPHDILPGPAQVLPNLWNQLNHGQLWQAIGTTLRRAVIGFALALAVGTVAGLLVSRVRAVRAAVGSLIAGVDFTPPVLLRAGKTMGLRRVALYRHLILPASLPPFVAGLKQGWAFAWHGLFAGELLVIVANQPSIGVLLSSDQQQSDITGVISLMIVILVLGIAVDILFNVLNQSIRRRRGLAPENDQARS